MELQKYIDVEKAASRYQNSIDANKLDKACSIRKGRGIMEGNCNNQKSVKSCVYRIRKKKRGIYRGIFGVSNVNPSTKINYGAAVELPRPLQKGLGSFVKSKILRNGKNS